MTTTVEREPNLAQPWAPHRVKVYLAVTAITGIVFVGMTIGVGVGLIAPTFTADVIANLLFGVPVILMPLVLLWEGKGNPRSRLEKASELVLVYLPYAAASQIGYELVFLIGHPFGLGSQPRIRAGSGCGGSTGWPTRATPTTTTGSSGWSSWASSSV